MEFASLVGRRSKSEPGPLPVTTATHLHFKEGRLVIGPEMAQRILDDCNYAGQRTLDTAHIEVLANAMHRGQFTDGTQIHFGKLPNRWVLVNGYHRLHGVIQANAEIEFSVLVTECDAEDEVAKLYYRHDTVARKRTMLDAIRAAGVNTQHGLSEQDAGRALAAVVMIVTGFRHWARYQGDKSATILRSPDARLEVMTPWWPATMAYFGAIQPAERHLRIDLLRSSVLSVGMMTFKYQKEKAQSFWSAVAEDDGLRRGDPRKTLVDYLRSTRGHSKAAFIVRGVSLAWNAYFEDRALTLIRVFPESPVSILGTPIGRKNGKAA